MDPTAPNNPNNNQNPPGSQSTPPPRQPVNPSASQPYSDLPKQDAYATAIDPNDPLVNSIPTEQTPMDSSIQTGQFVSAGGNQESSQPTPQMSSDLPPAPVPAPPYIGQPPNINQEQVSPPQFQSASTVPGAVPMPPGNQPDPTPYTPPPPTPGSQQVSAGGGSMIKKLRLLAIIAGVLVLLGAIGALVWFFVIGKAPAQPTQTEAEIQQSQAVVEEPTPLPVRTENGFGTLPGLQSTSSAQAATPSAQ